MTPRQVQMSCVERAREIIAPYVETDGEGDVDSEGLISAIAAALAGSDRRDRRLADLLAAAERLAGEAHAACCPYNFDESGLEAAVRDYRTALVFWQAEGPADG